MMPLHQADVPAAVEPLSYVLESTVISTAAPIIPSANTRIRHNDMKLEEAIVYLLASSGQGMKTEQIAREINERKLYERWDHEPVTGKQVYAVVMSHPETFVKSEGRIRLII